MKKDYFKQPNDVYVTNKEHINIHITSTRKLGKVLDPNYIKVINYPYIGKFSSVKSLWHWLHGSYNETIEDDDQVRKLVGPGLVAYAKKHKLYGKHIPNFKAIIAYATWLKLKDYPDLLEELKSLDASTVFLSYTCVKNSELKIATSYAGLMVQTVDSIQNALLKNKEPDFTELMDRGMCSGLFFLEPYLRKKLPNNELNELKELYQLTKEND